MKAFRKLISILLVLAMTAALTAGCGKKSGDTSDSSGGLLGSVSDKLTDDAGNGEVGEAADSSEIAVIPGHYDLWTFATEGGGNWTDVPHEDMVMTGFVFLEEDHTGKMGQSVSGTESANNDITWDEDGNISMFGQNLYTFEVKGDVLAVDMGGGAAMYYYVREGVDGAMAYNNFKEGKAVKDAAAITADATNGEDTGGIEVGENNDITYSEMPVPAGCMYHVAAVDNGVKRITGNDLKKKGYDEYWLQSGVGGEVDFAMGTSDLHDGSYFLDDVYGAITRYKTETAEPLYPYSVADDGDVLFVKTRSDTLIFAREGVDPGTALKHAGETPDLKIKSGDIPEGLSGYTLSLIHI